MKIEIDRSGEGDHSVYHAHLKGSGWSAWGRTREEAVNSLRDILFDQQMKTEWDAIPEEERQRLRADSDRVIREMYEYWPEWHDAMARMKVTETGRGFEIIEHEAYLEDATPSRLVQQSSAVGEYEGAVDNPGSSFLWVGDRHHLTRGEVRELARRLDAWLETGSLRLEGEGV